MPPKTKLNSEKSKKARERVPLNAAKSVPVGMSYSAPRVQFKASAPSKDADARYCGVDFVGTISSLSTGVFTSRFEYMYATNADLFPRLAAIAKAFVRYRFRSLRFHLIGKSASTQKGLGSFGSYVNDLLGGSITPANAAAVKNSQGVLTLRGWESGVHTVEVSGAGLKWYSSDTDGEQTFQGLGDTFYTIEQTAANGDLSWDIYTEYDIEFTEAWIPSGINLKKDTQGSQPPEASVDPKIRKLEEEIAYLRKQVTSC